VEEHDLGHDIAAETGVNIERDPDTVRAPDYGFISYDRMAEPPPSRGFADVIPDLVVTRREKSSRERETQPGVDSFHFVRDNIGRYRHPAFRCVGSCGPVQPGSR
jgi:soluble lytic murein transglycosylase-like protein